MYLAKNTFWRTNKKNLNLVLEKWLSGFKNPDYSYTSESEDPDSFPAPSGGFQLLLMTVPRDLVLFWPP